jgi:hypothetical protein
LARDWVSNKGSEVFIGKFVPKISGLRRIMKG